MRICVLSSVHRALDNRVFYREARTLHRAGHEVVLVAVHDRAEVREGIRIEPLPSVRRWRRPAVWRELTRRALASGADAFHFHDPELLPVVARIGRRTGRPTVYDVHEAYPEFVAVKDYLPAIVRYPLAWAFRVAEPRLARRHSALVFADEATPEAFRQVARPQVVLPNYPDLELVGAGARLLGTVASRPPVVLYLGGLERNRGSRLMVEAFARLHSRRPDARLVVVGHFMPPGLEDEVRADLDRRGLGHAASLVGRVPFAQVPQYLEQAAVGWVPWQPFAKNHKNVPTKLFEYLAFGLPVVASDLGSTRPFVDDGVTGRLVAAGDPEAHSAALGALLDERPAAAALGRAGRDEVVRRWNWQAVEHRLVDLYQVLGAPQSG